MTTFFSQDISGLNIMRNMTSKKVPSPTLCPRLNQALMQPSGCPADPLLTLFMVTIFNTLALQVKCNIGFIDLTPLPQPNLIIGPGTLDPQFIADSKIESF